ncbi:MAG: S8 family peptidase [bacterium]|nr:S8 family peptidase [bacterium]
MRKRTCIAVCALLATIVPSVSVTAVEVVPGEILVKFKPGATDRLAQQTVSARGADVLYTSPYAGFRKVRVRRAALTERVIEQLRRNPWVEYAVLNSIAHAHWSPNDSYYPYQWHFDDERLGANPYGGANGGGIRLEPAWDISTGSGVVVAVLDTGVAYENYGSTYLRAPDLVYTLFVAGWDFANNDSHPNDDHSHGTHVTGTIAQSTNNGIGVAGVAYNCSIMPVKVLNSNGQGTLEWLADGIYYAVDNGADVINMSLGWPPGYDPGQPLKDALDYAYDNGVTVVCSSGNDSAGTVSYPAAYPTTLAVGATRYDETRPSYSNYGDALDICAPGGDLTVDQNGDLYGDGVLQNTFNPTTRNPKAFGYWFFSGTSMAAPHVSGVAALLIARGVATPDDVRYALESTAEDKGASGWDAVYGWGLVDAYAALTVPLVYSSTDGDLMSFEQQEVSPPFTAVLTGKEDVPGEGVEYTFALGGFGETDINIGAASPATNLAAYETYTLTFTNTSVNDFYNIMVYVKTGAGETIYQSGYLALMPGNSADWHLNLTGIPNLNDVREIGFGLKAYIGQGFGLADEMRIKVKQKPNVL